MHKGRCMFFLPKHKRLGMAKSKVGKRKVEALSLEYLSPCFEGFVFWSLGKWGGMIPFAKL